ncbi:hypothetical protein RU87_GL001804 [Lactococcus plantarum]|uniref:Uncharacterized protein n=1 Tax=Pseudolactococcus plantarum TaxID=1365 RepID=A0A2A5RYJ3_9LACT|nr:hypothetical protein RU87_GL001804 [Lactococcus plantarum]
MKSIVIKKFKTAHTLADTLNRQNLILSEPVEKNQVWSPQITYILTQQGWCYLSTIMDCYTK